MTHLERAIDGFVTELVDAYPKRTGIGSRKILHDPIWGTQTLSAAEIDVLDTPLMQRLRFVGQTALAFLTYPSARHTRFEHSIGVMFAATRMAEALNAAKSDMDPEVLPVERQELRLAALLHDLGHAFFSHVSENMYRGHGWISEITHDPRYAHAKPHEILSSFVVESPAFSRLLARVKERHLSSDPTFASVDLDNIAQLILGRYPKSPRKRFLGDMINGPFDADKLDYIARDAYFTGLTLTVDMDRLLYSLRARLDQNPEGEPESVYRLVTTSKGASALEQVLTSKLRLYEVLYHHPKVRSADRMMEIIGYHVSECSGTMAEGIAEGGAGSIVLDTPVDYLRYTDIDFLCTQAHADGELREMVKAIRRRDLPMKALVISRQTTTKDAIRRMLKRWAYPRMDVPALREVARQIYVKIPHGAKSGYTANHIIIDIPPTPLLTEAPLMQVIGYNDDGKEVLESLNTRTRVHDWCTTSMINKWRGHVFAPAAIQREVHEAALAVFKEHGFEFNSNAKNLANIR